MTATMTPTCSHCGELRTEGQPHDDRRCWTIAHAYASQTSRGFGVDETSSHIVELSRWLRDHPKQSRHPAVCRSPGGTRTLDHQGPTHRDQVISPGAGRPRNFEED